MKITILGSCRQESLSSYFDITNIKEGLTYPHYPKEIVQAIEFCKNVSTMPDEFTRLMFRSGILQKRQLRPEEFQKSFNETDLFVIEIATRVQYEYKGLYAHQILSEVKYGFHDYQNVLKTDATDEEIEKDVVRMRELLGEKPFIIVSHICTRNSGKRYDLVELLKKICEKHGIPLFLPHEQLADEDPGKLYVQERNLAHYTDFGDKCVGMRYKQFIDNLKHSVGNVV